MDDGIITAVATPLGEAGLAVIRVSGNHALELMDSCFRPAMRQGKRPSETPGYRMLYGHMMDGERPLDEVVLGIFRGPKSFTGEDTVEISCHGGILITRKILELVLRKGARMAEPGEFSKRAFLNGRLDLTQAEAVADLIHARSDFALRAAQEQLAGKLAQRIHPVRDGLMLVLAHVEAHVDFPDEDIAPETHDRLLGRLDNALREIKELMRYGNEGHLLRRGIRVAIVGRPNVGKSSLLNQLLGKDRAIVSPVPGTTRDTIEETANIRGVPVVFIDTAGLRETIDAIEQEGIRRSEAVAGQADLILYLVDAREGGEALEIWSRAGQLGGAKRILVRNKADLLPSGEGPAEEKQNAADGTPIVTLSCATGQGLETLKETLVGLFWSGAMVNESWELMISVRHRDALERTYTAVERTLGSLHSGASLEFAALDLRIAVQAIGEIVGKTSNEDLLDTIFSQFCLGK